MAIFTSYDLNGKKDSFANWISNLSPVDTLFVSTTKKEQVTNTLFQWQTDSLAAVDLNNAQKEGEVIATFKDIKPTKVIDNVTQILRKAVEVTDTADEIESWGRGKELAYQMELAGKEIKRDLEAILLQLGQTKTVGAANSARKTASFGKLVADLDAKQDGTDAVVHKKTGTVGSMTEVQLFDLTYNLYLAGSNADIIMFHPKHASFFSSLMELGAGRTKVIENVETTLNKFVGTLIDPLGQQYQLVPNRFMPEDAVYFFKPENWTQMILRAPEKAKLAKKGSSERYMIEMEIGLRHKNPFASGILELKA